jgi:hypothetical protein
MARFRSLCCALLVMLALARVGYADAPKCTCDLICKVYALSDFGADPTLCQFIAETIPHVVQPQSWSDQGGSARLRYYAPGKVLVVYQSAAAHTEVESFLKSLKSAMPSGQGTTKTGTPGILPAQYLAPTQAARTPPSVATQPMPYPVPPATQQPKHLFHFIIRYEGEGIIDSNVAELYKAMSAANANGEGKPPMPVPACVGVPLSTYMPEAGLTLPSSAYLTQPPTYMPPCTSSGTCPTWNPPMMQGSFPTLPPLRSSPVPNAVPASGTTSSGWAPPNAPGAPANPAPAKPSTAPFSSGNSNASLRD